MQVSVKGRRVQSIFLGTQETKPPVIVFDCSVSLEDSPSTFLPEDISCSLEGSLVCLVIPDNEVDIPVPPRVTLE